MLLQCDFWGNEVTLYTISCMWSMKITILNTKTLQEYCICHDCQLDHIDVAVTFNASNHFNAAGEWSTWWSLGNFCLRNVVDVVVKLTL